MSRTEQLTICAATVFAAALYYPSLSGFPVWDDQPEWFMNAFITMDYSEIFRSYAWPGTIGFFKLLVSIFKYQFHAYHAISVSVHLFNALLVYSILKDLRFQHVLPVYLLFLFHPANVITVAWMIQLKTLLCFFFAALACKVYIRYPIRKGKGGFGLAYLCSLLFKSSSITLPGLVVLRYERFLTRRNVVIGGVVALIFLAFAFRIFSSGEASELGASVFPDGYYSQRVRAFCRIVRYYFFQSVIPIDTIPVKDFDLSRGFLFDVLVVLGIYTIIFRGGNQMYNRVLFGAFIMLLPVLSIIPAPFMNHTLVGDHHLYLALPLFLSFFFLLPVRWELARTLASGILLVYYIFKVHVSIPYFQNDRVFYEAILREYPASVSMSMNLTSYHYGRGDFDNAFKVVAAVDKEGLGNPRVKNSKYYPDFVRLGEELREKKQLFELQKSRPTDRR